MLERIVQGDYDNYSLCDKAERIGEYFLKKFIAIHLETEQGFEISCSYF